MQSTVLLHHPQTALRIAVVTETYPPEINGVARTVGIMVDELLARGHQIELTRPRQVSDGGQSPATELNGFEERLTIGFPIPKYPELQLGITRMGRLIKAWRERRPDVVHLVTKYVGRLAAEKNLRLFVETIRAARWHRPDLRVVIVGDGPMGKRLHSGNPDFLFAGMRTSEDLAAYYASADLFVFPSLSETFGNVTKPSASTDGR